jgi:hypothetical protein
MRKFFLSFADSRMAGALARIRTQAEDMQCYDHIVVADQSYLNIDFREKYKDKLTAKVRGYGYWCWKPQVILQLLDQVEDGDIIQYTDAGCHLNKNGRTRLMEYFELAEHSESGILAFSAFPPSFHDTSIDLPDLSDYKWCKADLLEYMKVSDNDAVTHSQTVTAGIVFIKKSTRSREIIQKWADVIAADFSLLDDSKSKKENIEGFVEHRHDQSIFSVLCKLNHVALVSCYEYGYPSKYSSGPDWDALKNYPIHAKRDKAMNFQMRVIDIAKKVDRRLRRLFA